MFTSRNAFLATKFSSLDISSQTNHKFNHSRQVSIWIWEISFQNFTLKRTEEFDVISVIYLEIFQSISNIFRHYIKVRLLNCPTALPLLWAGKVFMFIFSLLLFSNSWRWFWDFFEWVDLQPISQRFLHFSTTFFSSIGNGPDLSSPPPPTPLAIWMLCSCSRIDYVNIVNISRFVNWHLATLNPFHQFVAENHHLIYGPHLHYQVI